MGGDASRGSAEVGDADGEGGTGMSEELILRPGVGVVDGSVVRGVFEVSGVGDGTSSDVDVVVLVPSCLLTTPACRLIRLGNKNFGSSTWRSRLGSVRP